MMDWPWVQTTELDSEWDITALPPTVESASTMSLSFVPVPPPVPTSSTSPVIPITMTTQLPAPTVTASQTFMTSTTSISVSHLSNTSFSPSLRMPTASSTTFANASAPTMIPTLPSSNQHEPSTGKALSAGAWAGIVLGIFIVINLFVLLAFTLRRLYMRKRETERRIKVETYKRDLYARNLYRKRSTADDSSATGHFESFLTRHFPRKTEDQTYILEEAGDVSDVSRSRGVV